MENCCERGGKNLRNAFERGLKVIFIHAEKHYAKLPTEFSGGLMLRLNFYDVNLQTHSSLVWSQLESRLFSCNLPNYVHQFIYLLARKFRLRSISKMISTALQTRLRILFNCVTVLFKLNKYLHNQIALSVQSDWDCRLNLKCQCETMAALNLIMVLCIIHYTKYMHGH